MPSRESQSDRQRIEVAGPTALGDAMAATRRYALDQQLGERDQARLCIVVEELITNLCEHGLCDTAHDIGLELVRRPDAIEVTIEDNGTPFDPRSAPERLVPSPRGGGAGLGLVRAWATITSYESNDGRNRLRLTLALGEG